MAIWFCHRLLGGLFDIFQFRMGDLDGIDPGRLLGGTPLCRRKSYHWSARRWFRISDCAVSPLDSSGAVERCSPRNVAIVKGKLRQPGKDTQGIDLRRRWCLMNWAFSYFSGDSSTYSNSRILTARKIADIAF